MKVKNLRAHSVQVPDVSQPKGRKTNPVRSPVNVTGPLPKVLGSVPVMNEKLEKLSPPVRVEAVTPPTVPPLKSPGCAKADRVV
jgi:hypothetical protein